MNSEYIKALDILKQGGVVVFPTDTVYGIGCLYDDIDAVKRIFEIKKRDINKALPILVSSINDLLKVSINVSDEAFKLADAFWPGALTLLVNKNNTVSDAVTCNKSTVAVRMPNNPDLTEMIAELGKPIIGTSANVSGESSITDYKDAYNQFNNVVDLVINGKCHDNFSSTIIDVTGDKPVILRQGPVTKEQILTLTNIEI